MVPPTEALSRPESNDTFSGISDEAADEAMPVYTPRFKRILLS